MHSESPLMQNPFIMNPNATSILLKWSPPFLWPGRSIDNYIINLISINNSQVKNDMFYVNATFSDAVVSFLKVSDNPTEILSCNEILFGISAVTDDNGTDSELSSFTVVGGYLPSSTIIHHDKNIMFIQSISTPLHVSHPAGVNAINNTKSYVVLL